MAPIVTVSGHKLQSAALLRQVQARASVPIPAPSPSESIPAERLESPPPGMAAAEDVPARLLRAQQKQMEQAASVAKPRAPLRTVIRPTSNEE